MDSPSKICINKKRKFGLEIELNSLDGRDFNSFPLGHGEQPKGMDYVCQLIEKNIYEEAIPSRYHYTHNNPCWIVKPDRSCGMEICTPVMTWNRVDTLCKLITILADDESVLTDDRCSLHVHVNVEDLSDFQVATIAAYWVKCEAVFMDSVEVGRKRNQFCQIIGLSDIFTTESKMDSEIIIQKLGDNKYRTMNTFHLRHRKRRTIEFRIIGNEGCKDSHLVKNWIGLLLHFTDVVKHLPLPSSYSPNDPWSGFLWLDPKDVFNLLGFHNSEISSELIPVRKWFLDRLVKNVTSTTSRGSWSGIDRARSKMEIGQLFAEFNSGSECMSKP